LPGDVRKTREGRGILAGIQSYLGLALLGTANKQGVRDRSHDVLRNEACTLLHAAGQFNEEVRAAKLMVVDEGNAAELAQGLALCKSGVDNR
jgi:hypothetical protein